MGAAPLLPPGQDPRPSSPTAAAGGASSPRRAPWRGGLGSPPGLSRVSPSPRLPTPRPKQGEAATRAIPKRVRRRCRASAQLSALPPRLPPRAAPRPGGLGGERLRPGRGAVPAGCWSRAAPRPGISASRSWVRAKPPKRGGGCAQPREAQRRRGGRAPPPAAGAERAAPEGSSASGLCSAPSYN